MLRITPLSSPAHLGAPHTTKGGVARLPLLCAAIVLVLAGAGGYAIVSHNSPARRALRAAESLRWEITAARSFAMRSGRPMTLVIDGPSHRVLLRDGPATRRSIQIGDRSRGPRIRRGGAPGTRDSLRFSPRGLCLDCGALEPTELLVETGQRTVAVRLRRAGPVQLLPMERVTR